MFHQNLIGLLTSTPGHSQGKNLQSLSDFKLLVCNFNLFISIYQGKSIVY